MKKFNLLLTILLVFLGLPTFASDVIDVHSHNILPEYLKVLKKHHAELEETFPLPDWNVENHLKFMDEAGIKTSFLSMPAPQPYYGSIKETKKLIREINEISAKIKKENPDRFKFFAVLPLPDVDSAIEEAIYALDTLGADGIKLATNSRGQYVGDIELEPLMKVLNERNAIIVLHPHKPMPYNEHIIKTAPLAIYEYPAETTRTVINMISNNTLSKYPNIKVVVPHAGSFLPLAIPRMKSIYPIMHVKGLMGEIDFDKNINNLYFDLAGNPDTKLIKMLLTITEPTHILYGSDYPYQPQNILKINLDNLKKNIKEDSELSQYLDLFLYKNAQNLFKIEKE